MTSHRQTLPQVTSQTDTATGDLQQTDTQANTVTGDLQQADTATGDLPQTGIATVIRDTYQRFKAGADRCPE